MSRCNEDGVGRNNGAVNEDEWCVSQGVLDFVALNNGYYRLGRGCTDLKQFLKLFGDAFIILL